MTPESIELRQQAEVHLRQWSQALTAVVQLPLEAARLRAKATALEAAEEARPAVAQAQAAVEDAERAYCETAGPEEAAVAKATRARHEAEACADALNQAREAGEEPARLRELLKDAESAATVAGWEEQALASAQDARLQAKHDLDAARARLAHAQEDLAAKEAAVDAPLTSPDRDITERMQSLMGCWSVRVAARNIPGQEMDPTDFAIARELRSAAAADLHVCPSGIAWDIATQAAWAAATRPHGAKVEIPFVGTTTITKLLAEHEKARRAVR